MINFTYFDDICPLNQKFKHRTNKRLSDRYITTKELLGWAAKAAMKGKPIFKGPVKVDIKAWTSCDIDALDKVILDAMQGIVYENDRQIKDRRTRNFKGKNRTEITVEDMSLDNKTTSAKITKK